MKTLLLVSTLFLGAALYGQCRFSEDYSDTTGWTQVGMDVEVANGKLEFQNGSADGVQRRVFKSLGTTLNANSYWSAKFEFTPTSVGRRGGLPFTGHNLFSLTAGVMEPFNDCPPNVSCSPSPPRPIGTQDVIAVGFEATNPTDGNTYFHIITRDGSTEFKSSRIIANTLNTTYYIHLERLSPSEVKLSIFSDSMRTIHIPNSPIRDTIPATVTGLTTIQQGNMARGYYQRELTGSIDDLCINYEISTAISELEENNIKVFPNPTTGILYIKTPSHLR